MAMVIRTADRLSWRVALHPARWWTLFWKQRSLLAQLVRREVTGRYRGSLLGTAWSLLLPCLAVMVYTLVFGLILKQRWPGMETSSWCYPLVLWAGLSLYQAFAEVIQRATSIIAAQPNLVKKVVFPLEVLPVVLVGTSLVPLGLSLAVVLVGITLALQQIPDIGMVFFTLFFFVVWLQGVAWFLAGVGAFLRDLAPMVQAVTPLVLFVSPIFYPVAAVPGPYQPWYWINPLAVAVETMRAALLHTTLPPTWAITGFCVVSLLTWHGGALVFARLRLEMADVV